MLIAKTDSMDRVGRADLVKRDSADRAYLASLPVHDCDISVKLT